MMKWLKVKYEFPTSVSVPYESIPELPEDIDAREIGIVFSIDDIQKCHIKNGKQGSKDCVVTMKNGTYFKVTIPDNAGPTGEMPNHTEYSERILEMMKTRA